MACRGGMCGLRSNSTVKTNFPRGSSMPTNQNKPFAAVSALGADANKPVSLARKKWNNFLRAMGGLVGIKQPRYTTQGAPEGMAIPEEENILELLETSPPEVKEAMNQMIEAITPRLQEITSALPNLSFDELMKFNPEDLGLPSLENLDRYLPDLGQTEFAPIAAEAERRFQQETVPGIMNQLTGLGQSGRSSSFQGALGKAGADLQSKLSALESAHNLERGKLQLGQGDLAGKLYEAATKRGGILGALNADINKLGLGRAESLGRFQLGQQGNQLNQQGQLLSALSGQMNRPTTGYQPPAASNPWYDVGSTMMPLAAKIGSKFLTNSLL